MLFGKTAQNTAVHFGRQLQAVFLADLIDIGGYDPADFARLMVSAEKAAWGLRRQGLTLKERLEV